jgi:hypothetical protein
MIINKKESDKSDVPLRAVAFVANDVAVITAVRGGNSLRALTHKPRA